MTNKSLDNEKKDFNTCIAVTTNEVFRLSLPVLRDLFDKSIQAKEGMYPLWNLQVEMCACISKIEKTRERYSKCKIKYRDLISNFESQRVSSETIAAAKTTLLDIQSKIDAHKFLIKQLRSIGDSIAWRFLRYHRPNLRILAEHEHVSVVSEGKGRLAELDSFARLTAEGYPVLINGITNCLRFGDLLTWDESTGNFELIEVKAGPSEDSRSKRQSEKRERAQEGISNSTHNSLYVIFICVL